MTQSWRVQNRYDLQTDIYTIDGIGALGKFDTRYIRELNDGVVNFTKTVNDGVVNFTKTVNDGVVNFTRSIIIEPITRVGEEITDLYKHKSDLDYEKEIASYDFMNANDSLTFDAEKTKLMLVLIAVCFLMVFVFNF